MRIGDVVYTSNGDFGPVPMTAVNVHSGEILWRDRSFSRASTILADGKLVVLDEDGTLGLARVSERGLEVMAEHQILDRRAWTPPALHGRMLFVRDREELMAFELPGGEER